MPRLPLRLLTPFCLPALLAAPAERLPVDLLCLKGGALWLQPAQGKARRLPTPKGLLDPVLSPDSRRIAFVQLEPGKKPHQDTRSLALLDVGQTTPRILLRPEGGQVSRPRWSPDGRHLLFAEYRGTWGTSVIAVDGSGHRPLHFPTTGQQDAWPGGWAPDGHSVYTHGFEQLTRLDLQGRVRQAWPFKGFGLEVTSSAASLSVAPDGRRVLLSLPLDTPDLEVDGYPGMGLVLLDLETHAQRRISPPGLQGLHPHWLPGDTHVLIQSTRGLLRLEVATGATQVLIPGGTEASLGRPQTP